MKKIVFLIIPLLFCSQVSADANLDSTEKDKTFLLTAPGTITGVPASADKKKPSNDSGRINNFIQPKQYQYIRDNYKFPQYGRQRARPNPWLDRPYQHYRTSPQDAQKDFNNPWDISNLSDMGNPESYQNKPVSGRSMLTPAYGFFGGDYDDRSFYPEFNTPLDQDMQRPSSAAGFPYMDGLMPGLGNDDSGFPFMPFGMF